MRARARQLREQAASPALSLPLADRMREKAEELDQAAERHSHDRVTRAGAVA